MKKCVRKKFICWMLVLATMFFVSGYNLTSAYAVAVPSTDIASENDYISEDASAGPSAVRASSESGETFASSAECCPPLSYNGLLGEYYDTANPDPTTNQKLGYKRLIRIDKAPEFNWQMGSPDPVIEPDTFSVKWTGFIEVPKTGTYTFYTYSDDGVILKINKQEIINRWELVNLEFTTATPIDLTAGTRYKFEMQYQEIPLNSTVFLFWQCDGGEMDLVPASAFWTAMSDYYCYNSPVYVNRVKAQGNGLKGEYFVGAEGVNSSHPSPILTVDGQNINFEWGGSSPAGVPNDDFSARWTGYIETKYTEFGKLMIAVDDGVRLWSYDSLGRWRLFLDKWSPNSDVIYEVPIKMRAGGVYKIKIEYNEIGGGATCNLFWKSEGQAGEIIPLKYLYSSRP